MAHIVSFRIENLAGREDPLELELNRDTNIVFGLNGSGKTSLLKLLHSAMSNETAILRNVPFTTAQVTIYSIKWEKVFTKSITKPEPSRPVRRRARRATRRVSRRVVPSHVESEQQVVLIEEPHDVDELKWRCTAAIPRQAHSASWAHQYLPTTRLHIGAAPDSSYLRAFAGSPWLTEDRLDSFFAKSVERLWRDYSAKMLGAVSAAQEQGLASILRTVLSTKSTTRRRRKTALPPKVAYERVQEFLQRQHSKSILGTLPAFTRRYDADRTLQDVVRDIDSVEDKIKAAMASRSKLQELIAHMFKGNKELQLTDDSIDVCARSGDKIGLVSLSSGEKHLLQIFVLALLAEDNSMMIDEPELSMHVDWQKSLIHSLRALNGAAQLILATHSPEILADVPDDRIFRI